MLKFAAVLCVALAVACGSEVDDGVRYDDGVWAVPTGGTRTPEDEPGAGVNDVEPVASTPKYVTASSAVLDGVLGDRAFSGDANVVATSGSLETTSHVKVTQAGEDGFGMVWLRDVDASMFAADGIYEIEMPEDEHGAGPALYGTVVVCSGPDQTSLPFDEFVPAIVTVDDGVASISLTTSDGLTTEAVVHFTLE